MKYRITLDSINNINRSNFKALDCVLRRIIVSRMSHFPDLYDYLDDLVSNAYIVLTASARRYDSSKCNFSTYSFNRVVASSKKLYHSLKYPYSGIIALMGKTKKEQEAFLSSSMSTISSLDELDIDIPDSKYEGVFDYA